MIILIMRTPEIFLKKIVPGFNPEGEIRDILYLPKNYTKSSNIS